MPRVVQLDSAGLQLSLINGELVRSSAPEVIPTDGGLEAVSGPHIVRPPSYASNHRHSNNSTTAAIPADAAGVATGSPGGALPSVPDSGSSSTAVADDDPRADTAGSENTSASSVLDANVEGKSLALDRRKHWGLTWRQWLLVVGPSVLIVAIAGIIAGVIVSRQNASGNPSVPPANLPVSVTNVSYVSRSGAFNGTDIALARPGISNETLWLFYQDFEGDLNHIALASGGRWYGKGKISTVNGLANGSAITAFNFPTSNPTHVSHQICKEPV